MIAITATIKTFLFNLLCSIVSCDPEFGVPQITPNGKFRSDFYITLPAPIVHTNCGPVEGYFMETSEGRKIYAFEGIPYAEPPINGYRFQNTVKKKPWASTLSATKVSDYCLQIHPLKLFRVVGQEDCLYLNIYTPNLLQADDPNTVNSTTVIMNKLPVLIWVHGGSFLFGSGFEYGPAYLLNEDVILVTFNYRLGILGFMSTGDSVSPGNYGLKDQGLAIQWIHENIESFGGDSSRITLMGQSAGGVSVHLHMLSTQIKLFGSAISLSGNGFVHWAVQTPQEAQNWTIKAAEINGCPSDNTQAMVDCLRGLNPVFIVASQLNLLDWLPFPPVLFAPVIEPESLSAFLTGSPDTIYNQNQVARVPWISSMTAQEGWTALLFTEGLFRTDMIKRRWTELAPIVLNYKNKGGNGITEQISRFYFGNRGPMGATLQDIGDMVTDRYFTFGFHKGLQRHCSVGPTYGYFFNYRGNYNLGNALGFSSSQWGIGHGEDVYYYFNGSSTYPGFKSNDKERELSKIMVNLIVNFATRGNPSYTAENGSQLQIWTRVQNRTDVQVLQLNRDIKMISEPFKKRIRFWERLGLADTVPFLPI